MRPMVFALLALVMAAPAALVVAAPALAAPADFSGVWQPVGDGLAHPDDGGAVPLTPAAAAIARANAAAAARGDFAFDPAMHCLPYGTPRLMLVPSPVQLLVTANRVVFVHQLNHSARLVYLDRGHDPAVDPSFLGDSVGRWDGDTLVVDTTNFRAGLLDRSGVPVGEKLHVVERYRVSGRRITGRITVEDPANFTRAWSFAVVLERRPGGIVEDICADKTKAQRAATR